MSRHVPSVVLAALTLAAGCDGGEAAATAQAVSACHGDDRLWAVLEPGFYLRRHADLLVEFYGDELRGCRDIRKHISWYFKGYAVGGDMRARLGLVDTLEALDELIADLDLDQDYPGAAAEGSRGRAGSPQARVALPEGWLETQELTGAAAEMIAQAELSVSGG